MWTIVAGTLWLDLLFLLDYRRGMKHGYTDFTVLYTAGTILREGRGRQLYDRAIQFEVQEEFTGHLPFRRGPLPYIHPPFEALIFAPLSRLSYQYAFLTWDLISVGLLAAVAALLRQSVALLHSTATWKIVLFFVAFYPVFACLLQGQDSILQLLLCTFGFNAVNRNQNFRAGSWFALAAFKFQFIIPLIIFLIIWRRKRVAAGFCAVGFALALVSLALVGGQALLRYPIDAVRIVESPHLGGVPLSLLPNLHGLLAGWTKPFSGATGIAMALLVSMIVCLFAAWKGRVAVEGGRLDLQFSLAVLVSVLVGWQTNSHDFSLLILPLALLANYSFGGPGPGARFDLLLPAVAVLITPLWMVLWLDFAKVNLMVIPMLWWVWKIGLELGRKGRAAPGQALPLQDYVS